MTGPPGGFVMRAPWWARVRHGIDLNQPAALRPVIQMYDSTSFVEQALADPGRSLRFGLDDRWSYPVPASVAGLHGRARFATSVLVHTRLRKLYQPSHQRFYTVVVEVFCDRAGLPRAGGHEDLQVNLVLRRNRTELVGSKGSVRSLASRLLVDLARHEHGLSLSGPVGDRDVRDVWSADRAWRDAFAEDNASLLDEVRATTVEEAWVVDTSGQGSWTTAAADARAGPGPDGTGEELLPMWRLPAPPGACVGAHTRSVWFGVVPTGSAAHFVDADGRHLPKLDDRAVYQVRCVVTRPAEPGKEHCPPVRDVSSPTVPFRLAAAYDPDGTKNLSVSIAAPDLRRLAARAGQLQGAGGLHVTTPARSRLGPVGFKKIPSAGIGAAGDGGICTFAFELFFIVAFFLFLLFLPIVVLCFQLWWMLALRFCFPPSASFKVLADFFATTPNAPFAAAQRAALDDVLGVPGAVAALGTTALGTDRGMLRDLVEAVDPDASTAAGTGRREYTTPPDPLCSAEERQARSVRTGAARATAG